MAIKQCIKNVALLRQDLDEAIKSIVNELFPIEGNRYEVRLKKLDISPVHFTTKDMKTAVQKRKSLTYPIKVDLELYDREQRKVIDKISNYTLLNNLAFTPDSTVIMDGNEYVSGMLMRLKPGVYTKRGNDGTVSSDFRLKGKSMKLTMDPESGIFSVKIGSINVKLYPVLNKLGLKDADISRVLGPELMRVNKVSDPKKIDLEFSHFYKALVPNPKEGEDKLSRINERLQNTALDKTVTKITLGEEFDHVTAQSLLLSAKKVVDVVNDRTEEDEPDSLEFQTIDTVVDRLKAHVMKELKMVKMKIVGKTRFLSDQDAQKYLERGNGELTKYVMGGSSPLNKTIKKFYNDDQLTSTSDFINPLEKIDLLHKVSRMGGEGGIQSSFAITSSIRQIHPTSLGLIDPIRTPLSGKVGVDQKFTEAAYKDEDGNLYLRVLDIKNFQIKKLPVHNLRSEKIILPTEFKKIAHILPKLRKGKATAKDLNIEVETYAGNNQFKKEKLKDCNYIIEHTSNLFSPTTNMIPFLNSTEGVRGMMGANQITQALPLVDAESPLVQTVNNNIHQAHKYMNVAKRKTPISEEELLSKKMRLNITAPTNGKVTKIDKNDYVIYFKGDNGKLYKLEYHQYYPTRKTMLHHDVKCEVGKTYKKGALLAKSIYADDKGSIAIGKNLQIAFMPYKGLNHEDAIVVSESGAKKLTSRHLISEKFEVTKDYITNLKKFKTMFPVKYNNSQYSKLDSDGVIKEGKKVIPGDPLFVALEAISINQQAQQLAKIHKSFAKQQKAHMHEWHYEFPGKVIEVTKTSRTIHISIEYFAPAVAGDKLSGRFGNKGVIVEVIEDAKMPKIEGSDAPLDAMMTPAGVVARINPSQLYEVSLGQIAKEKGTKFKVEGFGPKDNLQFVKQQLKKHKVNPYKKVHDPSNGITTLNPVQTGYHYFMKLSKTTNVNFNARGTGSYDLNEQPLKAPGNKHGNPMNVGSMELNAFIGHNAREMLKDVELKGQKNTDYWNAVKFNQFLPKAKENFAFKHRFKGLLNAGGMDIQREPDHWKLLPLTSEYIRKASNGKIQNYKQVSLKNFEPEDGGLFDKKITGGLDGDKYAHIELEDEAVIHPLFIDGIRLLLGMKKTELQQTFKQKGGEYIKKLLKRIDLKKKEREVLAIVKDKKTKNQKLSDAVKLLKITRTLLNNAMRPEEAFMLSDVPVIPPKLRPLMVLGNRIENSNLNLFYRDIMMAKESLGLAKDLGDQKDIEESRDLLQQNISALIGMGPSPNVALKNKKGVKGAVAIIKGEEPKSGFFQSRLLKKRQDFSGRATIAPDINLGLEEVGMPEDMAWKMYEVFVGKRLSKLGYNPIQVDELIENRTNIAKDALIAEMKDRPVYVNRPPTLWKYSMFSAFPKLTPGKTLKVNPFIEAGTNADYDGDALILQLPVSERAKEEAKTKTMSHLLFSEKSKGELLVAPSQEPILGMYKATKNPSKGVSSFKDLNEAKEALKAGKINFNQKITLKK